jgi:hypothetical protein
MVQATSAGAQIEQVGVFHHGGHGALQVPMEFSLHVGFKQGSRTGHGAGGGGCPDRSQGEPAKGAAALS